MSERDLDAAGITDPALRACYEQCRRLNAEHGKTYYLATLLLPAAKRPHVHALYGFARYADEFVDSLVDPHPEALTPWGERFLADLDGGDSADPVCRAVIHTIRTWDIPPPLFKAFLDSMAMDLTVSEYATFEDLRGYMYGSAAVIGLQMLPILEPLDDRAYAPAQALGEAFQLTNFIRDVAEDLERGRVYLPLEDLEQFGVTREQLAAEARAGASSPAVRDLVRFEVDRCRELYAAAAPGPLLLDPTSRDCIRTAAALYGGILDEIEDAGYEVLAERRSVPLPRRLRVAVPGLARAALARREQASWRRLSPVR
ncbi:phytoene/squalene synthase family protein [Motilibacter aurantiacus]|uniref:phytoene/squalene synthase family protein n=1 Tax=Motilibacter aurantiacus TaxID=2714955 RepID=UPI00140AACAB|nr:phytoene/squalene synthase family protein [Motilibacter aurantiacus]NHC45598.1 phytoene/squalene synthase family protein [Motilibacter aurantiacus]